jgi:hypothetical protein
MDRLPDTLAPEVGDVMEIKGAFVSAVVTTLLTDTEIDALAAFPAASLAVAVRV